MSRLLYSQSNITRNDLSNMVTPAPIGARHHPVPFGSYVDSVEHSLKNIGMQFGNQEFEVTHNGNRFFGAVEIEPMEGEYLPASEAAKDFNFIVGLRGSHDNSLARGLSLGTQVMVCSNLCFHGNLFTVSTKQTLNVMKRLPGLIGDAIRTLPAMQQETVNMFDRYKLAQITEKTGDAALVEIYRQNGLTGSQLGRAVDQWYEPSHAEHAEDGFNAWRLLNACTEALKPTGNNVNHDIIQARSMVISSFIDRLAA
jgi:hypothetical protein